MAQTAEARARRKVAQGRRFGEWGVLSPIEDWKRGDYIIRQRAAEMYGEIVRQPAPEWPSEGIDREYLLAFFRHHRRLHGHVSESDAPRNEEVAELRHELEAFRTRLEKIEVILQGVDAPASIDPELAWCHANLDKLNHYPNSFVAIDTKRGEVVVSAVDQSQFIRELERLEPAFRKSLLRIHTSLFLLPSAT